MTYTRRPPAEKHTKQQEQDRENRCDVDLTATQVFCEQREAIAAKARSQTCGGEDPQKAVGSAESAKD
jgi:hypothetical protein